MFSDNFSYVGMSFGRYFVVIVVQKVGDGGC